MSGAYRWRTLVAVFALAVVGPSPAQKSSLPPCSTAATLSVVLPDGSVYRASRIDYEPAGKRFIVTRVACDGFERSGSARKVPR